MASPLSLFMRVLPGLTLQDVGAALADIQPQLDAALASVGTVHYARTLFLDVSATNLQPDLTANPPGTGPFVIGIITEYDGSFSAYIQDFVNKVGKEFDALLSLVEGGKALIPVASNLGAFTQFIAANDASQHAPNNGNPPPASGGPGGLYQAYTQGVQQIIAAFS